MTCNSIAQNLGHLKTSPEDQSISGELQVHSHTYDTAEIPSAKFTYDLSPIQILVSEKHGAW